MTSSRRQRIEQLCRLARELPPLSRNAYLAEACGSDQNLRREVEAVLAGDAPTHDMVSDTAWAPPDGVSDISAGARLGPYEIVSALGAGGMGKVYRAVDTRLGRHVAIKVSSQQFSARFDREARAVAALNHPHICTLHDVGPNYLVMELVEGESLAACIARGPLPAESVLRYSMQIAEALEAAHSTGVIHRDLKPANIMLIKTGVKVLDFGLAKFTGGQAAAAASDPNLTGTHVMLGTPAYMSPEQALGQELDARTDLFSLGVIMYEMATGIRPFAGATTGSMLDAILHKEPVAPCEVNPSMPGALGHVIQKALEKNRDKRYQNTAEMLSDLAQVATHPQRAPVPGAHWNRKVVIAAIAALAVLSLAAMLIVPRWMKPTPLQSKRMLAVLPFQNLSGDISKEYFSDGLTEEVIAALSRLDPERLGVIARTSAMYYKNKQFRVDQIGRELGVDYVLEGSARHEGGKVRATAELINARDQSHLWADSYDVRNAESMTLQRDITRRVARSLAINLLPSRQSALERASSSDPVAYELYLNGRYHWNQRTEAGLRKAIEYFESAVSQDPGYAAAYANLASSLDLIQVYARTPPPQAAERATAAVTKALQLDPELSEAYGTRAEIHQHTDWDRHAAESDHRRAIELNPGDATAHAWYGEFLYLGGRMEESWPQLKAAERLDPLSPAIQGNIAWWYMLSHRFDDSVAHNRRQLAKWPGFGVMEYVLAETFDQMGRYPEAIEAYQSAIKHLGRVPYVISALAHTYARMGDRTAALRLVEEMRPKDGKCHPSGAPAVAYIGLGDREMALACIERAIEQHSALVAWLKAAPQLKPLHGDPRFTALLRRAGFDPE